MPFTEEAQGDLLATAQGQNKRLALSDAHSDVIAGINPTDTTLTGLTESATYDPFGQVTAESSGGTAGNIGYQGDWTDPTTNQINMHARWYNPNTGNFNSRDDWTLNPKPSIQANRYTYANADPITNTDPTGHYCWSCLMVDIPKTGLETGLKTIGTIGAWASRANWIGLGIWGMYNIFKPTRLADEGLPPSGESYRDDSYYRRCRIPSLCTRNRPSGSSGGGGVSPGLTAAQLAEAARKAALDRARAITAEARRRAAWAAKHNPLPVLKAALRPVYTSPTAIVSTKPHVPAKRVSGVRDIVADHNKIVQGIYDKAVANAGPVIHDVSTAAQVVPETAPPNAQSRDDDGCHSIKDYGQRDTYDRPMGVYAKFCNSSDLKGGTKADPKINPPGFPEPDSIGKSTNPLDGRARKYARCHLLGKQLGGSGDVSNNLVTCIQKPVNTPNMRKIETEVKNAVKDGQEVDYWAVPVYRRGNLMPDAIRIIARGTKGGVSTLNIDKCVINRPYGRVYNGNLCRS